MLHSMQFLVSRFLHRVESVKVRGKRCRIRITRFKVRGAVGCRDCRSLAGSHKHVGQLSVLFYAAARMACKRAYYTYYEYYYYLLHEYYAADNYRGHSQHRTQPVKRKTQRHISNSWKM